jgi:uncharacterized protein (DUF433 family)
MNVKSLGGAAAAEASRSASSGPIRKRKEVMEQQATDESKLLERITINPDICHGKPCIRGLRYPVATILELLSAGMSTEEILADYDDLEREDILAVLAFAARLSQVKRVHAVVR